MSKLSYPELQEFVKNIVLAGKLSVADFNVTRDNTVGLLDKIGKIVTLDSNFATDKLNIFDGEYLSFGKTIEEWFEDLIMPEAKGDGSDALTPHRPTYRPAFYSYTIGKKVIPTTIDYNDIERAVHFEAQFAEIVAMKYKRLSDSMAQYRYQVKREMIAKLYAICVDDNWLSDSSHSEISWNLDDGTAWNTGVGADCAGGYQCVLVEDSGSTPANVPYLGKYIAVKNIASASTKTIAELVAEGYLIKLDLITEIAKPVSDVTGEAFIKQLKKDVEIASDSSEGHSLNGNSLGATEGLVLILKQGVMPSLEADTWSGAFHKEMLALPAETIVVKDFGSCDSKVYGVLVDRRGLRLHNTYNATRSNENGAGDFLNVFRHTEDTAYISRNTFVKFYKEA